MTKETAFRNASLEIQLKAQEISGSQTPDEAKEEYDCGRGYLCALYDTGIFDRDTFEAGARLMEAAYRAAVQRADKKTAPGAANTESGSKGGHPRTDDSLTHSFSIDSIFLIVKRGGERV